MLEVKEVLMYFLNVLTGATNFPELPEKYLNSLLKTKCSRSSPLREERFPRGVNRSTYNNHRKN